MTAVSAKSPRARAHVAKPDSLASVAPAPSSRGRKVLKKVATTPRDKPGFIRVRSGTVRLNPDKYVVIPVQSPLTYQPGEMRSFIHSVERATPYQLVDIERRGVHGRLIMDLATTMHLPKTRVLSILGIPRATAGTKATSGAAIKGSAGQAALGMVKLLGIAQAIIDNSDSPDAEGFDASRWLGEWIERPQPALGGRKPSDLLDTPTGVEVVARLLGAIESGAYQ